jgi:uncharacterized membrane protein HdeD (DUF308 family)
MDTKMNTTKHMRIAGILQTLQSLMFSTFGIWYVILYIQDLQKGSHTFEFQMALLLAFLVFIGICQLWFGISLAMQKGWTKRIGGYICCIPSLIFSTPPVIVGAYTIWVLVQVRKGGFREPSIEHEALGAIGK